MKKADYGIDAPGVIRNLLVIGAGLLAAAGVLRHFGISFQYACFWTGAALIAEGILMLAYSKWGKLRHRDRMLALHDWHGGEQVLDVGTGRGLLLIGAAKRLTAGKAIGIDIWNAEDLSGNARERTERNLAVEGVAARCTLLSEGAQKMEFADGSFDVVVSNLCLHNLYDRVERRKAVMEIARVLKPGGTAILSDYKKTGEYANWLREAGLTVKRRMPNLLTTFPPLTVITAQRKRGG
ncbi:MAG TPA: class I SAM-dependent methyltransferase [Acidobacteriaceae bacterium]|nr:class I SAM-dependent methyltransferase [Acidobacteriaceae bacterium]